MRYALQPADSTDGRLFDARRGCELFSQRLVTVGAGERRDGGDESADEVLYVLAGAGAFEADGEQLAVGPGAAIFAAAGERWMLSADEELQLVSVLVHDPERAGAPFAVVQTEDADRGAATSGRSFLLGATPAVGCTSVTQFVGLIPPGRAPDHFHRYDEVIYVLEGEGTLFVDGKAAPLRPGTCVHLPRTLVHCLSNDGEREMRVLGVFRPAGSPAEAYYPDGTPAPAPEDG
ncbi:MAG TPA: cupin domain-containing protein [Gaiellaceae bacterium]|nr:cupin domain-containing protein [Gaiellaceae bacterium]